LDFRASYPDLNLNGYQWLGPGYVGGRPTVGYRAIGQVGEDGVEQSLRWAVEHVEPEATLATFVPARHVVREFARPARFRVVDGVATERALGEADYALTCLNGDVIPAGDPDATGGDPFVYRYYDRAVLEDEFERVFSVRRAFDIEVAAVWRRR
jgi:hypothetical protein